MLKTLPLVLAFGLALGACASEEGELAAPPCDPVTTSTTDLTAKPIIDVPAGVEPPETLATCDVVQGTGEAIDTGDEITVHYVGVAWSTDEQFDASWDRDEPFQFQVGQGLVIQGWEFGVQDMRVGGRRELIIPPYQAYGPQGRPPAIGPNETLVFVIDVLSKDLGPS